MPLPFQKRSIQPWHCKYTQWWYCELNNIILIQIVFIETITILQIAIFFIFSIGCVCTLNIYLYCILCLYQQQQLSLFSIDSSVYQWVIVIVNIHTVLTERTGTSVMPQTLQISWWQFVRTFHVVHTRQWPTVTSTTKPLFNWLICCFQLCGNSQSEEIGLDFFLNYPDLFKIKSLTNFVIGCVLHEIGTNFHILRDFKK